MTAALQISNERAREILNKNLNMKKINARWVARMLTPLVKQRPLESRKDFSGVEPKCLGWNWQPHCNSWWNLDTSVWLLFQTAVVALGKGARPKKKKIIVEKSASKIVATISWYVERLLSSDFFPKETTINGKYYADLLNEARDAVVLERRADCCFCKTRQPFTPLGLLEMA